MIAKNNKMKSSYIKKDILESLQNCGIKKGDAVFVTTSLGMFGFLENAKSLDDINEAFYLSLCECVGETGSIIVPTYSYTFGKHTVTSPVIFDTQDIKAEIGPFPEFFRHQEGVIRSGDPFMSVAIKGPASALIENLTPTSYGHDCFFERLLGNNVICLNLGLGPNWTAFIHYADYLANVPFRYDKLFSGLYHDSKKIKQWLYSVPLISAEATANAHSVGLEAEGVGIWNYATLGRGRIYKASYDEYFNFVMNKLRGDRWALAKGSDCDVKLLELMRCNIPYNDFAKFGAITYFINELVTLISDELNFELLEFDTGLNAFDHIVPEAWYCSDISLTDSLGHNLPINTNSIIPYSQSFEGQITGFNLKNHINITSKFPRYIERDWELKIEPRLVQEDEMYSVKLSCGTYFSHASVAFKRGSFKYIYVINATDFHQSRELYELELKKLKDSPFCVLVVSHETAMVAWIAKYRQALEWNQEINLLCASEDSTWCSWDMCGYNPATKDSLIKQNYNFKIVII
ncbi:AAC(3) family N-acetyltransferase [Pseudoalteromonas sp. NZS71_1]|uniref:AAC(3) family N-acetyltransferase n=1 Tax=Pseudoalteromonas sp. NZS71_1 TaxID=2792072 RepID=UPI0018CDD6BA|nr:AAC(3) family N-acetyltransferase [Pseudoalteromonas sp. NZS71_1]MBH0033751.1 AAC(3) family N-acetyltransferase [Pseudoalteromonas sp. NZS71_1]